VQQPAENLLEQDVRLVEEEQQLRLRLVADLREGVVQLRKEPEHEGAEEARLVDDVRQLEERKHAFASVRACHEIVHIEFGLAEEVGGTGRLEIHNGSKDYGGRRRRHPAVPIELGMPPFGGQVAEHFAKVREVRQRNRVVVAVREDQRKDRRLRRVQFEDFAQEQGPNECTVARTGAPSTPDRDRSWAGCAAGLTVQLSREAR